MAGLIAARRYPHGRGVALLGSPLPVYLRAAASSSNLLLDYADISTANWTTAGDAITLTAKPSIVTGATARLAKTTGTTSATTRKLQTVGTFSGSPETAWAIVESADSENIGFGIFDSTSSAYAAATNVAVANGSLGAVVGTVSAQNLGRGPNGGTLYRIILSYTGTVGHTRQAFFFPNGRGTAALTGCIWHAGLVRVGG